METPVKSSMKKIGIVGGTAWVSTVQYYSELCRLSEARFGLTPEFSIESLDIHRASAYMGDPDNEESWSLFDAYHRTALERAASCGAEVAFLAANTPHHRFAAITQDVPLQIVNIIDAVALTAKALRIDSLLLLGTALTMKSRIIRRYFASHGIDVETPSEQDQQRVVGLIGRLQRGRVSGAAQEIRSFNKHGKCVVLGCTELALAFPESKLIPVFEDSGTTYLNSLAIHVQAILDAAAS
jgi:aspartate racemase